MRVYSINQTALWYMEPRSVFRYVLKALTACLRNGIDINGCHRASHIIRSIINIGNSSSMKINRRK